MIVRYVLSENNFLTYQLFVASKSKRMKRKELFLRLLLPVLYAPFFILYLNSQNFFTAGCFFIVGFAWFLIYPMIRRYIHKRHYRSFIRENYAQRVGKNVSLELEDEFIISKTEGIETRIEMSQVEEIIEISSTIFIKLKTTGSFILPKDKIADLGQVIHQLKVLASQIGVPFSKDLRWKFK